MGEERRKKDEQGRINTDMLGKIEQYKQEEKNRKQRAQDDMTRWLQAEKDRKEEEERQNRIIYARKCEQAQKELEENRQLRAERKRLDDENELRLAALRNQIQDEQEAAKQKALQDRKDHIDRVSNTVGAAIAGRDAKEAADLEAKIKRVQGEADRLSKEDAERRRTTHAKKVQNCKETWDKQLVERDKINEIKRE